MNISLIIFTLIPCFNYTLDACLLSCFSCVGLFGTLLAVARQAPLSVGFSRQEYWSGLPCPPPGDLVNSGIQAPSLKSPTLAGGFLPLSHLGSPIIFWINQVK